MPRSDAGAVEQYRRYHGYIVLHAKALCRAVPRCEACPLLARCPYGTERVDGNRGRAGEIAAGKSAS